MKGQFNTWNNKPCRTIFYHVTQGSHRAALYCLYNHRELFTDVLLERIVTFLYLYWRREYQYDSSCKLYDELNHFFSTVFRDNDVDLLVQSFIYSFLCRFNYGRNK